MTRCNFFETKRDIMKTNPLRFILGTNLQAFVRTVFLLAAPTSLLSFGLAAGVAKASNVKSPRPLTDLKPSTL